MAEWQETTADIFCMSVRDGTHDSPKPASRGQKLITSRHIIGGRIDLESAYLISDSDFEAINRRSRVDQWDVLITMIGTVGEPCLVRLHPDFAIKNIGLFKSKGELEGKWLYYYLRDNSTQQLIRELSAGTTQSYIALSALRNLTIRSPKSRREMEAIVSVLGALDDKIELNRRMNETLEETARTIFKDWFVDFGPTRAKMESRAPYLAAEIWSLFPESLDEEGQPEGWHTGKVSEIGQVVCGKTPSTTVKEYYGNDVPFVTIPDMHDKIFALTSSKNLSLLGAASQPRKTLPPGSICVSCIATPGLVVMTTRPSQTNQQINSVIPNNLDESLYWYWVFRDLGEEIRQGGSGGSVLSNLSTGRFMELRVLFSSANARAAYKDIAKPLFDRILQNETESQTLAATRNFLLPKLISGEVRVKDAEKLVGEAT
jgi:type I restriction enzyme S subunit